MPKPPRPYTVHHPKPIRKLDDNLWVVDDTVPGIPGGTFPRTMAIARRQDGDLVLWNAIPLDDAGLAELETLGKPRWLVAPSPFHCIDAHAMREKLGVDVVAPAQALTGVGERVEVKGALDVIPPDPTVRFFTLRGTRFDESVMLVSSGERVSLVFCDAFFNIPPGMIPGFYGWLWKVFGFAGGPRSGPIWLKRAVVDRPALRASLDELAATPGLARLVPSHGVPLTEDVVATLRGVASRIP